MFDKEMTNALRADAEKLNQLTGGDHTPEFLADCESCGGSGEILETIQVYEAGCGFSHPDVAGKPCQACGGNGWFIVEEEGDVRSASDRCADCPSRYLNGGCGNPSCPAG